MNPEPNSAADDAAKVSLTRFVGYFLRLGTVGFGGPIALAGHMQQDLVEHRGRVRTHSITRWPTSFESNFPMALDEETIGFSSRHAHRLS